MVPAPSFNFVLRVLQVHEPVIVQALLTQPPIEAFHHGVIRGLARPAEVQFDVPLISLFIHHLADELAAIV